MCKSHNCYSVMTQKNLACDVGNLRGEHDALDAMDLEDLLDDSAIAEEARIAVRRGFRETHGKRPLVTVHVVRI